MSQRIEEGIYRGRGVAGSAQFGQTSNNNDQIVVDLDLLEIGERVSTFLVLSAAAKPYSERRLVALGCERINGQIDLSGIDRNEVNVEVKYEEYKGEMKMKVQIMTGGTVKLERPCEGKELKGFAARHGFVLSSMMAQGQVSSPAAQTPERSAQRAPQRNAPAPQRQQQATGTDDYAGGADDDIPF